jgi:hypothetical protein
MSHYLSIMRFAHMLFFFHLVVSSSVPFQATEVSFFTAKEKMTQQRGYCLTHVHPSDDPDTDTHADMFAVHGFETKSPST